MTVPRFKTLLLSTIGSMVFLVTPGCAGHGAQDGIDWVRSLSEATGRAAAENKLIVADIYADWCPWCKRMDANTWPDPAVIRESANYVFLKINGETDPDGVALRRKFGISGFPTVVILTPEGDEFERLEGYLPAEEFLESLRAAVDDPDSLGNLTRKERTSPDLETRYQLGKKLMERRRYEEAAARFERIVKTDPKNGSKLTDLALFNLALCQAVRSDTEASVKTVDRLRREFPESKVTPNAWLLSGEILMRAGMLEDARTRLQAFLKAFPDHSLAEQAKKLLARM